MKTTIDLPDELVKRLKLRAVREGRKVKDLAAEILRDGLALPHSKKELPRSKIVRDKLTGLPVIQCRRAPRRGDELTPDEVARILMEQEAQWYGGVAE